MGLTPVMNTPSKRRPNAWVVLAIGSALSAFLGTLLLVGIAGCSTGTKVAQNTPPAQKPAVTPSAVQPATHGSADNPAIAQFHKDIQPILAENCYECHGGGKSSGGIAFDKLTTEDQLLNNPELWFKVLKNTRAGIMPAGGNPRLSAKEQATLDNWIKFAAFGVDPQNLDPGRVTVHRLNRAEYRNTIRDLLGVDFNTDVEFPSDDIGYGFDNIADVLNVSPLLMERYLTTAQTVVDQAVPGTA